MTKLLVVDDNEQNRCLLQTLLTRHGYDVILAGDGLEALDKARDNPPGMIISDILMPGMDGYALCRHWKRDEKLKSIPFVFYTATYTDPDDEQLALDMGAARFIVKPQEPQAFLNMIEAVLAEHKAGRQPPPREALPEDTVYLKEYNAALIRKLEDKLVQLESGKASLEREVATCLRAVDAFRTVSSRQEALLDAVPDIIMEVDKTKVYLWANRAGMEFFGEDVIGREASFYFEGVQDAYDVIQSLFDGDENVTYIESWQRRRDGEKRLLAWWCRVLKDEQGNVTGALSAAQDITERTRGEMELRESEGRLTDLMFNMVDWVWETDENGIYTYSSQKGLDHLGISSKGIIGKTPFDFMPPEEAKRVAAIFSEISARKAPVKDLENWNIGKDGKEICLLTNAVPIVGAEGNLTGYRGVDKDITERKRAGEFLRASEERFKKIFEEAPLGVALIDSLTGQIREVNPRFAAIAGRTREEMATIDWMSITHPDDVQKDLDNMALLNAGKIAGFQMEKRYIHLDGAVVWINMTIAPLGGVDKAHPAQHHLCLIEDITERKRAEVELRKLSMAVSQSPASIVITDLLGNIEYVNQKFTENSGYTLEDVRGQNPRLLKSGETSPEEYELLWKTITSGGEWHGEFHNKRKDGTLSWERAFISPMRDASGTITHFLGFKENITQEKSLEEQLHQAQKMEAVGQLAGGVAHDFNNILQGMVGYSSLLLDRLPEHDETHEFAEEIFQGAERAAGLTRQLLAFSRRQTLEMEDLELAEVVHGLTKMIRRLIGENIEVVVMDGRGLGMIHADRGQMEQVLLNLCINARDAMLEGGVLTIGTENVVLDSEYCNLHTWAAPGRYVLLSVTDNGCGMDAQTQTRIFEPFFTTKALGKGTGLGLSTVYGIVRQHHGMVQVYSEVGMGTTFKVYLPNVEPAASTVEVKIVERAKGGTETILLAEDEEALRTLAARILESAGYTVLLAADGKEALDVFEKYAAEIDLCLLDVVMPKMGGKAVYDVLRQQHPHLPFLFSSGYSVDAIHTGFVLKEGIELIQKPYAPEALLRRVRHVLDTAQKGPR